MPTPTSSSAAASALPDEATLACIASELFRDATQSLQGSRLPQASAASPASALPDAAALRAASPGGVSVPGSSSSLSVPASVPGWNDGLPGDVTLSPATDDAPSIGPPERKREDRIVPRPYALPGERDLGDVLALLRPAAAATDVAPAVVPTSAPHSFYFLDTSGPPASAYAPSDAPPGSAPFDVNAIRRDFPILAERVNGRPLVWLDNAATTQKPAAVIERLKHFYEHENSNVHRAAHTLAARATDAYEAARDKVASFLGAGSSDEIVFVRGATEAINLVAQSYGAIAVREGDEILVTHLEHHANIVPWQQLAVRTGAKLRVAPVDDRGDLLLAEFGRLLGPRTRIVAVTQVSNALGTIVPVAEIVAMAHRAGATVLVDGAQAVSHLPVDVRALDADFYVFSGHKVFGPTGIGVVYGKKALLERMPPWQGGGNMIADVRFDHTTFAGPPARFEAGTGNIADAAGLGAAIDYVQRLGMANIERYEHDLLVYATAALERIPGLRLIGTAPRKASVLSFVLDGYRVEEVGEALSREGIAVRAGHHCAQPILRRFGLEATVRPSLAFYNTCDEIDALAGAITRLAAARGTRRT